MRIPSPEKVTKIDDYCVLLELFVSSELIFFPGHFPVQNVLPGVVMVDWVVEFSQRYLPITIQFQCIEALKFRQVVTPPSKVYLRMQFNPETHKLLFSYTGDNDVSYSSGKISQAQVVTNV